MAAIDLSSVTLVPFVHSKASVGTTWQEVKLPTWTCRVTVVSSAAAWVTVPNAETPADGGSVGTHKVGIPSDSGAVFVIRGPDNKPVIPGLTYATSIFVAAQSGTATISVTLEAGRQ
jgi:hypothetical protein